MIYSIYRIQCIIQILQKVRSIGTGELYEGLVLTDVNICK